MKIIHKEENPDGSYRYKFKLPSGSGRVTGIDALIQSVIMTWMTTRGRDEKDLEWGGGMMNIFRNLGDYPDIPVLSSAIASSVSTTENLIITDQAKRNLPESQKLSKLNLLAVNIENGRPSIQVEITNVAGESSAITL